MKTVKECLETEVKYECDVLVAGGGFAGIAAALSAARAGRAMGQETRVILLERGYMLGGLATAGLVTIYLALCDGRGHKVARGIAEELFMLSIKHGAEARYPTAWLDGGTEEERAKYRFEVQFNPQLFAIEAEKLLLSEGVKILYGATAVGCGVNDKKITHVMIEGKGGREAISVSRSVVDSTGDADICKLSFAKTVNFTPGNKLAAWYYGYGNHNYDLYMCGVNDIKLDTATSIPDDFRFSGLDTDELSRVTEISHSALLSDLLKRRSEIPDLVPVTIGTIPQVRMTRRLSGAIEHGIEEQSYADTVGLFPNWKKRGPVYELSFGALYGGEIINLLTAGRCISVTEEMWDVTRVIPVCAVSGEAAGAAAAMFDHMPCADVTLLQSYLKGAGVLLHRGEERDDG